MQLTGEYKGWTITHDGDRYRARKDETWIKKNDMKALKRAINKAERMKRTPGFGRTPAFTMNTFEHGTITSIADIDDSWEGERIEVWFSYTDPIPQQGRLRERLDLARLIKDTPDNQSRVREIRLLIKERQKLEKELERFKVSDFLKEGSE